MASPHSSQCSNDEDLANRGSRQTRSGDRHMTDPIWDQQDSGTSGASRRTLKRETDGALDLSVRRQAVPGVTAPAQDSSNFPLTTSSGSVSLSSSVTAFSNIYPYMGPWQGVGSTYNNLSSPFSSTTGTNIVSDTSAVFYSHSFASFSGVPKTQPASGSESHLAGDCFRIRKPLPIRAGTDSPLDLSPCPTPRVQAYDLLAPSSVSAFQAFGTTCRIGDSEPSADTDTLKSSDSSGDEWGQALSQKLHISDPPEQRGEIIIITSDDAEESDCNDSDSPDSGDDSSSWSGKHKYVALCDKKAKAREKKGDRKETKASGTQKGKATAKTKHIEPQKKNKKCSDYRDRIEVWDDSDSDESFHMITRSAKRKMTEQGNTERKKMAKTRDSGDNEDYENEKNKYGDKDEKNKYGDGGDGENKYGDNGDCENIGDDGNDGDIEDDGENAINDEKDNQGENPALTRSMARFLASQEQPSSTTHKSRTWPTPKTFTFLDRLIMDIMNENTHGLDQDDLKIETCSWLNAEWVKTFKTRKRRLIVHVLESVGLFLPDGEIEKMCSEAVVMYLRQKSWQRPASQNVPAPTPKVTRRFVEQLLCRVAIFHSTSAKELRYDAEQPGTSSSTVIWSGQNINIENAAVTLAKRGNQGVSFQVNPGTEVKFLFDGSLSESSVIVGPMN